jgi:hypothetical protein
MVTGQTKTTHKMGGSYPGNRRQANKPYNPPASQFSNGQATSHFVSYGGGNALVLKENGLAQPQIGASSYGNGKQDKQPQYVQVTLPSGVYGGQTIQVQAPDGRLNEIVVPSGFGPGSSFTVEFADETTAASHNNATNQSSSYGTSSYGTSSYGTTPASSATAAPTTAMARPVPPPQSSGNDNDDGFATGFGSLPTATDARPIYSASPY